MRIPLTRHLGRFTLGVTFASVLLLLSGPLAAQGKVYDFVPGDSLFETGCLAPSPCDCAAQLVGTVWGSFRLVPLAFSLGPVFEYSVTEFDAIIFSDTGPPITLTGSGTYTTDLSTLTQVLTLDLLVGGVPTDFSSEGAVTVTANFPNAIEIDVFHQIDSCLFDGIHVFANRQAEFIRGDGNEDGMIDIADAVRMLTFIIPQTGQQTPPPRCYDSMDANDDGLLNIADPVSIIEYLFVSGPLPQSPFPDCGPDPTEDLQPCENAPLCP